MATGESVTALLRQWKEGDQQALERLMPIVYEQLHKMAGNCMRSERPDHTLRATALVHEAYLRLAGSETAWESRVHFYAVAAQVLRHILVDHARAHLRDKRGGGAQKVDLDEAMLVCPETSDSVLELHEALQRLAIQDARRAQILELMYFGGMTYEETAAAIDISPATVHRELKLARAWLHRELTQAGTSPP
jgi:RNA polymerase sigma factor (TIGR02999 family)